MTKVLLGLAILFTGIILGGLRLFRESTQPIYQARSETTAYVQEYTDLKEVNNFYWFNGPEESYFSVSGTNGDQIPQLAIVRISDGAMQVFDYQDIASEYDVYQQVQADLDPSKILAIRAGFVDGTTPVWEVSFLDQAGQLGYYYANLETGQWLRTISNL